MRLNLSASVTASASQSSARRLVTDACQLLVTSHSSMCQLPVTQPVCLCHSLRFPVLVRPPDIATRLHILA